VLLLLLLLAVAAVEKWRREAAALRLLRLWRVEVSGRGGGDQRPANSSCSSNYTNHASTHSTTLARTTRTRGAIDFNQQRP